MTPIIEVNNLSKKYNITHQQGGYVALRDVLTNIAKSPFAFLKHKAKVAVGKAGKEEFWALKDINFEVQKGEAVGIIGANGAGKSTLLKILTGITPPTTGEIRMRGSVASLLEVGTGFHPELTGRENIFLNGAILGMTKKEISAKFNDIVKFSGIEKFIDTPVKRYSSGMYVRLAFSVAAHMEPDILLVDEVLAVGDAEFQKKCLGKMDEVTKKAGRTILFVSHNMSAIQNLCKRCILLKDGKITSIGPTQDIINDYINRTNSTLSPFVQIWDDDDIDTAPGNNLIKIKSLKIKPQLKTTKNNQTILDNTISTETPFNIEYEFYTLSPEVKLNLSVVFNTIKGEIAFNVVSKSINLKNGLHKSSLHIPANFLNDTIYSVTTYFIKHPSVLMFSWTDAISFEIHDTTERQGAWYGKWVGAVRPMLNFTLE